MKSMILTLFLLLSPFLRAQDLDPNSAYRDLNVPFTHYEQRVLESMPLDVIMRRTPLSTARVYSGDGLPATTPWSSYETMLERFKMIRDMRFIKWSKRPAFPRRASWLYPDDGCYARAALANKLLFRSNFPVPGKVFAFGNLRVRTSNSPRGVVGWWYHVAPIVQVSGVKYVLDPAVEAARPLKLEEWLSRMGNPNRIKIAICSSGAYIPGGNCDETTMGIESWAERAQSYYLNLEWSRIIRLHQNPELILGDNPPW